MAKTVLKNTQYKAVVLVTSENATTIDPSDLSYDVKVESGDVQFGAGGSKGVATRTQVPTKMDIAKIIYSQPQDSGKHVKVGRGGNINIILGGSGTMDLAGSGVLEDTADGPIEVLASTNGHPYTAIFFLDKVGTT